MYSHVNWLVFRMWKSGSSCAESVRSVGSRTAIWARRGRRCAWVRDIWYHLENSGKFWKCNSCDWHFFTLKHWGFAQLLHFKFCMLWMGTSMRHRSRPSEACENALDLALDVVGVKGGMGCSCRINFSMNMPLHVRPCSSMSSPQFVHEHFMNMSIHVSLIINCVQL